MKGISTTEGFLISEDLYFNGFPSSISIEITNRCNLRCRHCSHTYRSRMKTGDILDGVFEKVLPHLGNEIKSVSLNGLGEPLISSKWDDILGRCLDIDGLNISFITNGLKPLNLSEKFFRANTGITFSIDGASASTYKKIRGADVFDQVIANIRAIHGMKKERGLSHPIMDAIFVLTRHNMYEMAGFIRLAHEIGLNTVYFTHLVAYFKSQLLNDSAYFWQEDHDRYLSEALMEAERLGVNVVHMGGFGKSVNIPECPKYGWLSWDQNRNIQCDMIKNWCMVNYTGHVQVCCAPESLIAGDLRENTLLEVWNGHVYRRLKTGLSNSFEKSCGDMCNLRQTVSLNDIRGFYSELSETYDYDPEKVVQQTYNITKINKVYLDAIHAHYAREFSRSLSLCEDIIVIEPLAFEAYNLKGVNLVRMRDKEGAASSFIHSFELCKDYTFALGNLDILSRSACGG